MFYLKTNKISMLKSIFGGLSNLCPELKFVFEKNYIRASALNRANISASFVRILKFMFTEYDVDSNNEVMLNTHDVAMILKQAKDDDVVEFKSDENNAVLKITITTDKKKKEYEINTLSDIQVNSPPTDDMELKFKYNFDRDNLINAINSTLIVDTKDNTVMFKAGKGTFNIFKQANNKKANVCLDFVQVKEEHKSKYNSTELLNMLALGKEATYCSLKYSSDMPLIMSFETKDFFKIWFFLAPIVEND